METIFEFLKWWYTDFLLDDLAWTNILNLFSKTMLLLFGLALGLGIVGKILLPLLKFLDWLNHYGWRKEIKKH